MEVRMTEQKRNLRFRPLFAAAVAALGFGALALPTSSADAQVFFGCGIGGCGVGLGVPTPYYTAPYIVTRPYYREYVYTPFYYPW
jgi:hypothetical protein